MAKETIEIGGHKVTIETFKTMWRARPTDKKKYNSFVFGEFVELRPTIRKRVVAFLGTGDFHRVQVEPETLEFYCTDKTWQPYKIV